MNEILPRTNSQWGFCEIFRNLLNRINFRGIEKRHLHRPDFRFAFNIRLNIQYLKLWECSLLRIIETRSVRVNVNQTAFIYWSIHASVSIQFVDRNGNFPKLGSELKFAHIKNPLFSKVGLVFLRFYVIRVFKGLAWSFYIFEWAQSLSNAFFIAFECCVWENSCSAYYL